MTGSADGVRGSIEVSPARELMLFVADSEPNSLVARKNLRRILDKEPNVEFDLRIIDVLEDYREALEHRVLVTPCLLLLRPQARVMLVGALSDEEKVRAALGLGTEPATHV